MPDPTPNNDDLAALAGLARAIPPAAGSAADQASQAAPEDGQAAAGPEAPPPHDPQMAATIAGLIEGAAQMGSEFSGFESPRQLVDDSVCQYLGVVWARVAYKRGWNMKAILGDYGPEITAIAATGMIAFKVAKACEKEAEVKARQAAADQARTVTADPVPNGS